MLINTERDSTTPFISSLLTYAKNIVDSLSEKKAAEVVMSELKGQAASLALQGSFSHYFYLSTITNKYCIINCHSCLLELRARLMKKEYSGNLVANGLFQQIQDADQRQCRNIYFCDRRVMLTV